MHLQALNTHAENSVDVCGWLQIGGVRSDGLTRASNSKSRPQDARPAMAEADAERDAPYSERTH